jgi:hypothetical protein
MRWIVSVQTDGRQSAEMIRAAAHARRVEQLRLVNETLGRSRALSRCGHSSSANPQRELFCSRNRKSGFGFGPVGTDRSRMSTDPGQDRPTGCCGGCRQVTDLLVKS